MSNARHVCASCKQGFMHLHQLCGHNCTPILDRFLEGGLAAQEAADAAIAKAGFSPAVQPRCSCGHDFHEHAGILGKPKICTVLACACKRYSDRKPYEAPAITDKANVPPANDAERVTLAEFVRKALSNQPFVLAYLDVSADGGSARLATLSNSTEPQRLMRAALEELERQALASQGKAPLQ